MSQQQRIIVVLPDQLDPNGALFDDVNPATDVVWLCEWPVDQQPRWDHQQRLVLFFSALRHLRDHLLAKGLTVIYHAIDQAPPALSQAPFTDQLAKDLAEICPQRVVVMEPADWQLEQRLHAVLAAAPAAVDWREDRHFMASRNDFKRWAEGRKSLTMEYFYREMRKRYDILMEAGKPVGGEWNFDKDNRAAFGKDGPGALPEHPTFAPDAITLEVIAQVEARFADHPGHAGDFNQPVTPDQASAALDDFIANRLPDFGTFQDAIWTGEPLLFHARLSAALNLRLLDPRVCIDRAVAAWQAGAAPLNAVEGFVRQILGWREFIRGVYWTQMPQYAEHNALGHTAAMPALFWDGQTDMACLADAMSALQRYGYAHHIQRLMVLGLFAQLYGAHPYAFHQWHMAMYLDAHDWVSLPNALGMSQYGDGGIVGTKPYCASGAYIDRMSNACGQCRFNPKQATGEQACPFTTLYWDFLDRHEADLSQNRRMQFQLRNLQRKPAEQREAIRVQANQLREELSVPNKHKV